MVLTENHARAWQPASPHAPRALRPVCRGGFTLIELLVVVGIIALLVGILVPSVNGIRDRAIDVLCKANLKHLVDALRAHREANGHTNIWSWLSAAQEVGAEMVTVCPLGGYVAGGEQAKGSTSGAVTPITAPPSVVFNDFESNTKIYMFTERTNYDLPTQITVDITDSGYYSNNYARTSSVISAGTTVDSHFVFFDPVGSQNSTVTGSITMSAEILGIICTRGSLDATDDVLGKPGTNYPTGQNARNFENNAEIITLSEDRRTIIIHRWHSTFPGENMRIITLPSASGDGSFAMNSQVDNSFPRPGQILLIDYNSSVIYPSNPTHLETMENLIDDGRLHMGRHLNAALTDGTVTEFTPDQIMSDSPLW